MDLTQIDKSELIAKLSDHLRSELALMKNSQRQTQAAATHEESRPENDKDTRAIESSYLARGQAQRVIELSEALKRVALFQPAHFAPDARAALGALVELESDDANTLYFIAPAGGGIRLEVAGVEVRVVTPESPLGRAIIGGFVGDDVQVQSPQGIRICTLSRLR